MAFSCFQRLLPGRQFIKIYQYGPDNQLLFGGNLRNRQTDKQNGGAGEERRKERTDPSGPQETGRMIKQTLLGL